MSILLFIDVMLILYSNSHIPWVDKSLMAIIVAPLSTMDTQTKDARNCNFATITHQLSSVPYKCICTHQA